MGTLFILGVVNTIDLWIELLAVAVLGRSLRSRLLQVDWQLCVCRQTTLKWYKREFLSNERLMLQQAVWCGVVWKWCLSVCLSGAGWSGVVFSDCSVWKLCTAVLWQVCNWWRMLPYCRNILVTKTKTKSIWITKITLPYCTAQSHKLDGCALQ